MATNATAVLTAIDTALAAAWNHAGEHAPDYNIDADHAIVIGLDATLVTAHSCKENAAATLGCRLDTVVAGCVDNTHSPHAPAGQLAVNARGLLVSAGGALSPVLAAILHNASSVAVVGNSPRLIRCRPAPGNRVRWTRSAERRS